MKTVENTITSSREAIMLEERYGAHNYHPLPVTISRGEGVFVWDVEGKRYYDFLSAYGAVNQGHCHPRIVKAMVEQSRRLTLISRAFYNDKLGLAERYVCRLFDYDKALFMNSGAEANETAIKLVRRWGYEQKNIPDNAAVIVVAKHNFHGRTTAIISASSDPVSRNGFGPFMPGFKLIEYDNTRVLDEALQHPHVCALMIEPIQGEAGVYVPREGYLREVATLCKKHNVLLVMDEVQTGIARTGKMLASDYEQVHPDILVLGKALSGGLLPVSCVLARDKIMLGIRPGEHGSTYGGNPLSAMVCVEALQVVQDEEMMENAAKMGEIFRSRMQDMANTCRGRVLVRGKGLLNALVIDDDPAGDLSWKLCLQLKEKGLLAKPTHGNIIRCAPPLIITENQIHECSDIITDVVAGAVR